MTADELRAAAERLRRAEAEDSLAAVYGPMADKDNAGAYLRDRNALLAAWFREHPADDELPVTEEWLREVGFAREMQSAASNNLTFRAGEVVVTRWEPAESNSRRWSVQKYRADGPDWLPASLTPATRGAVRRLLTALGIHLAPKG